MVLNTTPQTDDAAPNEATLLREIAGYLNFSNGRPDAGFQKNINQLCGLSTAHQSWDYLQTLLAETLTKLSASLPAFANVEQGQSVVVLTFEHLWPAYRQHHRDLLHHLADAELQQPFFLVRLLEAVLQQGAPWNEHQRITADALSSLNDFIGFRPVAVLENERRCEPYDHERFRPVPLYIQGAGVANGRYHDLISNTIAFLQDTPAELLRNSHFDLSQLDELSLDVRAHDHTLPVNKRTNYMFGEWDPHQINTKGQYHRFIIRQIILDSLLHWMEHYQDCPYEERLYDASAVLCGTILMASAVSGSGPQTYDSSVTLTSLLPIIARQRDTYYARLLQSAKGERAERLHREAELLQQPFGHVRQYLNLYLADYGSRQVQHRHLSLIFARMGYSDASRKQASVIPSSSARFECEMQWRLTAADRLLDNSQLEESANLLGEVRGFLERGIQCGAIVDPWNILGFQAQFPLFAAREDSIPDQRIEALLDVMEGLFTVYSRAVGEAAAQGQTAFRDKLAKEFRELAEFWDQFASSVIEDLPKVLGRESWESSEHVSQALAEWQAAGEAAGDISFWRGHVERFESAKSYALVVEALLEKGDQVATMALLMQWLNQAGSVGLESGRHSLHRLLLEWMNQVTSGKDDRDECWRTLRRLFDYTEANAEEFWRVPSLSDVAGDSLGSSSGLPPVPPESSLTFDDENESDEFDDEDDDDLDLFGAAYDDVVFRDSALDGVDEDILEGQFAPGNTEFELICRTLEPRLRFLITLSQLWQSAAGWLTAETRHDEGDAPATTPHLAVHDAELPATLAGWCRQTRVFQQGLATLLNDIWNYEIDTIGGDHDANVEYDLQLQTKYYLLYTIIATHIHCQIAERSLMCCLSADDQAVKTSNEDRQMLQVYRGILNRDVATVRQLFPDLLRQLSRKPLLYVPLEDGGPPNQILAVRTLQTDIRFLLAELPRMGMFRETWYLVRAAYRMERSSRPRGQAVTEFDRLFRTALRNTLECLIEASTSWRSGKLTDTELIEIVEEITDAYIEQWLLHSKTMRLSVVESLEHEEFWVDIRSFIAKYGSELFHARMMTLGNIRSILHHGIEWFLNYLDETEDPLHPSELLEDLRRDEADREEVIELLEMVYKSAVEKFDRFLEYNTTTTQSDYGEMFYCLLDFLRVEAAYDRDAWKLVPYGIVHEVLARCGKTQAAVLWERVCQERSEDSAAGHLERLASLEKTYGMRLPSVTDRLNERFVKPLAVNRMLALVPQSMADARNGEESSEAFELLCREIDNYLTGTTGSGIESPPWLHSLEKELDHYESQTIEGIHDPILSVRAPSIPVSLREIRHQLKIWHQPLAKRSPTKRKKRGDT